MCDDKKKTTMILGGKKTLTFTAHSLNWKKICDHIEDLPLKDVW